MSSRSNPHRLLVGLTGGIASGKSTVARLLGERGCAVVDADAVVASLYEPGEPGARAVADLFGSEYLDARGAVDRPKVGARVFADEGDRRRLEQAVHPLVRERTDSILAESSGIVVYEATLLVEAGRAEAFDVVVSVEGDPDIRLARAVRRGMEEETARARLVAQGDGTLRRSKADVLIHNDGTLEELTAKVDDLFRDLQRRLAGDGA